MSKHYQVFKDGGHVMIHDFELSNYLQCGWELREDAKEQHHFETPDTSLKEWEEMINGIKGAGSTEKLKEIAKGLGIEVGEKPYVPKLKKELIDAYSKRDS
jgi:hypothetical protein